MNDRHYTPSEIAKRLVAAVQCRKVTRIADFAIGEGDLLNAARKRWPHATFIGSDIDPKAIRYIRRTHPTWLPCQSDFLSGEGVRRHFERHRVKTECDLILLNPPFSARKIRTVTVVIPTGETVECGRALAFAVRALSFCRLGGQIITILPSGAIDSARDASAWKYLRGVCKVEHLFSLRDNTFRKCSASAEVFRFTHYRKIARPAARNRKAIHNRYEAEISVVRGSVSIPDTLKREAPIKIVHSTSLQNYRVIDTKHFLSSAKTLEERRCVLIPRVGKPRVDKICLYLPNENMALSDCVIALSGRTDSETVALHLRLIADWNSFKRLYRGTGAPYVTIARLGKFLSRRGFQWKYVVPVRTNHVASIPMANAI